MEKVPTGSPRVWKDNPFLLIHIRRSFIGKVSALHLRISSYSFWGIDARLSGASTVDQDLFTRNAEDRKTGQYFFTKGIKEEGRRNPCLP